MGLYDRDYSRGPEPGFHVSAPTTATVQVVLFTGAVYLLQLAMGEPFNDVFALRAEWFRQPWHVYQLLTYGFLHDTQNIAHILINMAVLWMFGRELEQRYGRAEFLTFYLCSIIVAGLVWSLLEAASGVNAAMLGASGGVSAVVALFALNYPHRTVLFMFVVPMPMWVAAVIALGFDMYGASGRTDSNVAFTAHLAGALFGLMYYQFRWRLAAWLPRLDGMKLGRKPRLRVHAPGEEDEADDELGPEVDAILQKIQEQGQDSLSWNERRLLERASRKAREKRK